MSIWTVSIENEQKSANPIVYLHSLGYGASFWALNLSELSKHRTVYALDMIGFGRSSRVTFSSRLADIENEFVESLEAWRIVMGLEKMVLLGKNYESLNILIW